MTIELIKQSPKEIKKAISIPLFNATKQQYEPIVFPNGLKVGLTGNDFNRGIEIVSNSAPAVTSNRLYNENGTLKFSGTTIGGAGTSLTVEEVDGAPTVSSVSKIKVTNGTLTDNGGGTVTITTGGGGGSGAPTTAQYVTLATDSTLTNERVLTAGDGIDLTDGGAGSTATVAVDVTDIIDTAAGLAESSNNIQVNLYSLGGLSFDGGAIKVNVGSGVTLDGTGNIINDPQDENVVLSGMVYGG